MKIGGKISNSCRKPIAKKPAAKKKIPPRSQGDMDADWIAKKRRGAQGRLTETTLGFEAGLFSTQSQGIITSVVVREASQANRTEFPNWVDLYAQDWRLGDGRLSLSADGEFHTGESLKHFEDRISSGALVTRPPRLLIQSQAELEDCA